MYFIEGGEASHNISQPLCLISVPRPCHFPLMEAMKLLPLFVESSKGNRELFAVKQTASPFPKEFPNDAQQLTYNNSTHKAATWYESSGVSSPSGEALAKY